MASRHPEDARRVACLGEALVLLPHLPAQGGEVGAGDDGPGAGTLAGAEANVAAGLAAMDIPVSWVGRLGADTLGDFVRADLLRRGVDVGAVQIDPGRPTGYYAKQVAVGEDGELRSEMLYRRAGSAASAMGPAFIEDPAVSGVLSGAHLIHLSGITAALSESCAALMHALLGQPRRFGGTLCFDVNWREQLWPQGDPGLVVELSKLADIVLVGGDEALRVFGTDDPEAIRAILPGPQWIIIKDGARRALAVAADRTVVEQPALQVEVVEPVGAGDAFAAGFLAGVVRGDAMQRCLRRGHLSAAAVLTVPGDSAALPADEVVESLLASPPDSWEQTTVSAAGFAQRRLSREWG
jgi:2-dehydro-3-deoxygluconokinase